MKMTSLSTGGGPLADQPVAGASAFRRRQDGYGGQAGGKLLCVAALGIGLSIFAPAPASGATLSTNAAWTWIKGANITNQSGTYGTQGVPTPTNTPGARDAAVSWADSNGALWLFGGEGYPAAGGLGYLNDLWKFDPGTTNWTWMKGTNIINQYGIYGTQGVPTPTNTPGARQGAVTWADTNGALWLFGGLGYPAAGGIGRLNDLWKFDPGTTNWTWMKGTNIISQTGTYGTQGVPTPTNTPGSRWAAVSWADSNGALWLFGGNGYDATGGLGRLNDLWKFDPATTNWTWIKGANITNQRGTYGTQGVPTPTNTPGARNNAVTWADSNGALWLLGGNGYDATGGTGYLNDLWKFDPGTTNWTWMKGANITNQNGTYGTQGVPTPTNTPGARYNAESWADSNGALWLFGGYGYPAAGGVGYLNDLWKFDALLGGVISLATNALVFSATFQDVNPAAQMIGMANGGGSAFSYTNVITYGAGALGWLMVLPAAGTVASGSATTLTNQVNIAGLDAGIYYATNQITAVDASNSPQTVAVTLTVNKANQAITFPAIADQAVTGVVGLSATASSALPVIFTNLAGSPVTWQNSTTITFTATGRVSIAASQAGDTNWNAAPGITNSFMVTGAQSLSAPQNLAASDGSHVDKVALTWSAVSGATGYRAWRNTANDSSSATLAGTTTQTNYNDTGAVVGVLYYYWVKATNASGASAFSSSASGWRASISQGVCADYDGDGKADPAIYDEITGTWKVKLSSAGYYMIITTLNGLGGPGYASAAADYDGDNKADPAVYQELSGIWIILPSSLGYAAPIVLSQTLGGPGYSGVPADYDGDQLADPGVYQRTQGDWQVLLSSAGYSSIEVLGLLGGTGYRAVAADYDGDMQGDPAIYGESNGYWIFKLSSIGYVEIALTQTLGGSGYLPVPADYDGDGLADPAVKSATGAEWIVMLSSAGYAPVPVTLVFE